ncbi:MAG: substrate-binding domain-containing protein [Oscillospiraceae bacterium]|nr:substrate-binding domain-containing protein [Oscillospiraceae bacterium]
MKKTIILMLCLTICLSLIIGCKKEIQATPFDAGYPYTEENFPRIDGSTATIPLIEAVTCALLGKPRWEVDVSVSTTSDAYFALASGEADILFVYDGGENTRRLVNADEIFETVPIGKDALVFIVNRDNPIDNLTTEQVQKIFTGEYTNWSELGGNDEQIRAYQREEGSGSQTLMDKLVMQGLTMGDPTDVAIVRLMPELVEVVADNTERPTSIGYNVYFYVTEMRGNDYIKILSIDGIEPSYDTIQSGEYPFVGEFYSVIRKNEPIDSPARALFEWIQSDEAQNLIASENYVAIRNNPSARTPYVQGNYSPYPPGEEPIYFRGVDPYRLSARNDYGQLYFYLGKTRDEDYRVPIRFYGLCTQDGKVVTEPIYSIPLILNDSMGNQAYVCYRSDKEPQIFTYVDTYGDVEYEHKYELNPVLLFATDGSWVMELDKVQLFGSPEGPSYSAKNNDFLQAFFDGEMMIVNIKGEIISTTYENGNVRAYNYQRFSPLELRSFNIALTGDRFLVGDYFNGRRISELYNVDGNLFATGIQGYPSGMASTYFVTYESIYTSNFGASVFTYTLDGELIARMDSNEHFEITFAVLKGDYTLIFTPDRMLLCDSELNIIYDYYIGNDDELFDDSLRYTMGLNVLYRSDTNSNLHRTYLTDGTLLVSWFDPDMVYHYTDTNYFR